jgi:hypothetical protein
VVWWLMGPMKFNEGQPPRNEEDGAKIMTLESEENLNLNSHTEDTQNPLKFVAFILGQNTTTKKRVRFHHYGS